MGFYLKLSIFEKEHYVPLYEFINSLQVCCAFVATLQDK